MEATWPGCSLGLDGEVLTVRRDEEEVLVIPMAALTGFTVLKRGAPATGRAAAWTPDGELVIGWHEPGQPRRAHIPVPREALQVQLFLLRLAQLRPDADLRERPDEEALRIIGPVAAPPTRRHLVLVGGGLGLLLISAILSALALIR